jgi:hypothetical protein
MVVILSVLSIPLLHDPRSKMRASPPYSGRAARRRKAQAVAPQIFTAENHYHGKTVGNWVFLCRLGVFRPVRSAGGEKA